MGTCQAIPNNMYDTSYNYCGTLMGTELSIPSLRETVL